MQCPEMEGNDRRHCTILVNGEVPAIIKATEPPFYSCPFCLYTSTAEHSVHYHIENHATVKHKEFTIFRCGLNCRETTHFHCCYCSATLIRRDQFIKHLSNNQIHTTTQPQLLPASTDPNADFAGSKLSAQETEDCGKSVVPPQQVLGPILPTPQEPSTAKAPQASKLTAQPPPAARNPLVLLLLDNTKYIETVKCVQSCSSQRTKNADERFQFVQLRYQLLMSKADELQNRLSKEKDQIKREALAAKVSRIVFRCQHFLMFLESAARSRMSQLTELTPESLGHFNRCKQMLNFTEQLSEKLEKLVLTFASYGLLSLNESEPQSVSHFCIGGRMLGQLRLTTFRYCRPTPYLAQVNTGLYKRMRWNVKRLKRKHQAMEAETVSDTEYYFLCYEDMPIAHEEADGDSQGDSRGSAVRMWSIGQWEQKIPDPDKEDTSKGIMCEGKYRKLLSLGSDEPSSSSATDLLQKLLLSQQTTE